MTGITFLIVFVAEMLAMQTRVLEIRIRQNDGVWRKSLKLKVALAAILAIIAAGIVKVLVR